MERVTFCKVGRPLGGFFKDRESDGTNKVGKSFVIPNLSQALAWKSAPSCTHQANLNIGNNRIVLSVENESMMWNVTSGPWRWLMCSCDQFGQSRHLGSGQKHRCILHNEGMFSSIFNNASMSGHTQPRVAFRAIKHHRFDGHRPGRPVFQSLIKSDVMLHHGWRSHFFWHTWRFWPIRHSTSGE